MKFNSLKKSNSFETRWHHKERFGYTFGQVIISTFEATVKSNCNFLI